MVDFPRIRIHNCILTNECMLRERGYVKNRIKRWGNDGVVLIPENILQQANLRISSPMNLEVRRDGSIIIMGLAI